jgi:hypothetical protein
MYGDYDHLTNFAAMLQVKSGIEQHLALPIAFATLERVSRVEKDDIYAVEGAIQSVLTDIERGSLTLRDGTTTVSATAEAASRIQVITLQRYDFRMFQQFEINLMKARTLRVGEHQMTRGFGLATRPAIKLHDSYPEGQGVMGSHDLAELVRRLFRTLDDPVFVTIGHYLTAFELDIAIMIVRDLILSPDEQTFKGKNLRHVLDHLLDERARRRTEWGVRAPHLFV